ncbi:hypothetical protein AB3R30_03555 [Leptolyngbyaceae cyanobacterium UHCC 1019]
MSQPKLLDTVAILKDLLSEPLTLVELAIAAVDYLPSGLVRTILWIYSAGFIPRKSAAIAG